MAVCGELNRAYHEWRREVDLLRALGIVGTTSGPGPEPTPEEIGEQETSRQHQETSRAAEQPPVNAAPPTTATQTETPANPSVANPEAAGPSRGQPKKKKPAAKRRKGKRCGKCNKRRKRDQ